MPAKKKDLGDFHCYDTGSRIVEVRHIPLEEIRQYNKDNKVCGSVEHGRDVMLVPNDVSDAYRKFVFMHEDIHDILMEGELDKLIIGKADGAEEEILMTGLARGLLRFARLNPELWKIFAEVK